MNRPGYTLPPKMMLHPVPFVAQDGSVFATDERGSGTYVYAVLPNPATTGFTDQAYFYRYAIGRDGTPVADSWQQLATPTWIVTETVGGSGTDMIVDASTGLPWLVTADNAAGPIYHRLRWYDPAANTWTAVAPAAPNNLETVLALAATITHASLAHVCTAVSPAAATDDLIYLAVGNTATMAALSKAGGTWAAVGGGGARGAAPGAGSSLSFVASQPGRLYGLRGGATATFDRFTVATDTWSTVTLLPATETYAVGAEVTTVRGYPEKLFVHRNGSVKMIDVTTGAVEPICSLEGVDGAQHEGKGIVAYQVGTKLFVAVRKHSGVEWQRIELVL